MHTLLYLLSPIQRIQMPKSEAAGMEDPVHLDPTRVRVARAAAQDLRSRSLLLWQHHRLDVSRAARRPSR